MLHNLGKINLLGSDTEDTSKPARIHAFLLSLYQTVFNAQIIISIYPSGFITAVAVFRKPNAIPLCFSIDLFLNSLLSWLLLLLPSTFFLDVLFAFSPVVSNPCLILVFSPLTPPSLSNLYRYFSLNFGHLEKRNYPPPRGKWNHDTAVVQSLA